MNKDFIWGTATAAFQIEGANLEDGKEPCIWDTWCKIPGKIGDASDGSIACDSYHKYKEDVELLAGLGVSAYRFSIAWSRVQRKDGSVNPKGIAFYQNLCKELKKHNITPYVTLYHWDLPQYLQDKGGFMNPDFPLWFEEYTEIVTQALDGLVENYITFNEPQLICNHGHDMGIHPPGVHLETKKLLEVIHHLLLAHGRSVKVIRKNVKNSTVGMAPCGGGIIPAKENDPKLVAACQEAQFLCKNNGKIAAGLAIYLDPILLGDYPKEYYKEFKDCLPEIKKEDLELIHQPVDFLYQNIYYGMYYDFDALGNLVMLPKKQGFAHGNVDWLSFTPEAMKYVILELYQRYKMPIIISENGFCSHDWIHLDGKVHDPQRIDYIRRYLRALEEASQTCDVRGYFYWSLLDNFEWLYGYAKRFGLVYVDYEKDTKRIPKDSYYFYRDLIKEWKENGKIL